jgi:HSP20 family protein
MALVRWEPGREVDSLQSEVNRVFDAFFGGSAAGTASRARRWVPPMDLVETDDHLVLRADLPGMKRDDVEIEIKDGALTVSGERKAEHEENAEGYYRVERAYGRFSRSLTLPDGIEPDAVEAHFQDGVLEVRIPKPAERKPHRVEIGAGAASANGNGAAPETIEA